MRRFIMAAAVAVGLVALRAAILPLTAQPTTEQVVAMPPAISKALFLCRGQSALDHACVRALAEALMLDAPMQVSNRRCRVDQQTHANLGRRE
jgi:hypothetical protein